MSTHSYEQDPSSGRQEYPSYTPRSGGYQPPTADPAGPHQDYDQDDSGYPDFSGAGYGQQAGHQQTTSAEQYQQDQYQGGYQQPYPATHYPPGEPYPAAGYQQQEDYSAQQAPQYDATSYSGGYQQPYPPTYSPEQYETSGYAPQSSPGYSSGPQATPPFETSTEPFGAGEGMASTGYDATSAQPSSALGQEIMNALRQKNFSPRLDNDGDIMFEASDQVLFAQCTETPLPAIRMFGQWRIDAAVSANQQAQLAACSSVSMDSNFVKVGIMDKVVIARVDLLVFPGTDIAMLVDISVASIMRAITDWYQKVN